MFKWLRRFFYSDDEIVKLADGLGEVEGEQFEEMLRNEGIIAMRKNMSALAAYRGVWPIAGGEAGYALFVKQSDVDRAIEILGPMLGQGKLSRQDAASRREARRFRRRRAP
jgi:hypothetical protein